MGHLPLGNSMNRMTFLSTLVLTFASFAATASLSSQEQQFVDLGDFHLQDGQVIQNCRVGYRTYGTLNSDRSNVILWPTWFLGRSGDIAANIGSDKLLDPRKYYVIAVDALGDGVSSSPSNSSLQPRLEFPHFTMHDTVGSQYRLLTEKLGIKHIHAVLGQSMGGFQAFEWMVDYPSFMDLTVAVMGTPRAETSELLWAAVESSAIRNDKDWDNGNYAQQPKLLAARYMHLFIMWSPDQLNTNIKPEDADKLLTQGTMFGGNFDANDWLYQLDAIRSMDVYAGSSLKEAARRVKSKVLIVNGTQDLAVNATESIQFANALGVKPILLTGACGHMSVSCEASSLTPIIQKFLQ